MVAGPGRTLDEPGPWQPLCLERVRRAVGKRIWMEARRYLHRLHHCGGGVCPFVHSGRTAPGQNWPLSHLLDGGSPGQHGILPVRLHFQSHVPVHQLRRNWRTGQWLWLRYANPGNGQVVPGPPRLGGGSCRGRLWRRFCHFWSAGGQLSAAGVWLAGKLPDSGCDLPGDDGLWGLSAEESTCRLPSGWLDAGDGFEVSRHRP